MTLRFRSLLIAALAVVFVAGFGGIWPIQNAWGLGFGGSRTEQSGPSRSAPAMDVELIPPTAMFVPRRAPLTASLLADAKDLSVLRSRLAFSGKAARADWESFQNSFLADSDLEFDQDVKPWLGHDLTLAVTTLDLDRQAQNGNQPGYLLALTVKDPELAREFLQRYWQRQAANGSVLQIEQANGVRLIHRDAGQDFLQADTAVEPSDDPLRAITSAMVGDRFVLFSNSPKVIRDALNNVQVPSLNLASDPGYQRSLTALGSSRLLFAYANLDPLGGWLETQGLAVNRPNNRPSLESGESREASTEAEFPLQYQGLAISLGTSPKGVLANTALLSPPQSDADELADSEHSKAAAIEPARVLSYLPQDSIVAVSSAHLNEVWQRIQPLLDTYPALETVVDRALDPVQDDWNLDVTQEIFPWVQGEYGLGQMERPQGTDWVFVVERTSQAAQQGIQHLDELARNRGYSIGEVSLADREVTAWTSLKPEGEQDSAASAVRALVRGVHAEMGNYELFSTSLDAMEKVLQAQGGQALTETKMFNQAIAPLPNSNQGYLYINWQDNQTLLEKQLPILKVLELTAQPLFRNLKTITLSGYENQKAEGVQRVAVAFQLGK